MCSNPNNPNEENVTTILSLPRLTSLSLLGKLSVGGLFCPFSSKFITAVSRTLIIHVCVLRKQQYNNKIAWAVQRSCNVCNQYARMCHRRYFLEEMPELIIYKSVPEYFPIEEVSAQVYTPRWQPNNQATVNFPMPFKTSLQSFVRKSWRSTSPQNLGSERLWAGTRCTSIFQNCLSVNTCSRLYQW